MNNKNRKIDNYQDWMKLYLKDDKMNDYIRNIDYSAPIKEISPWEDLDFIPGNNGTELKPIDTQAIKSNKSNGNIPYWEIEKEKEKERERKRRIEYQNELKKQIEDKKRREMLEKEQRLKEDLKYEMKLKMETTPNQVNTFNNMRRSNGKYNKEFMTTNQIEQGYMNYNNNNILNNPQISNTKSNNYYNENNANDVDIRAVHTPQTQSQPPYVQNEEIANELYQSHPALKNILNKLPVISNNNNNQNVGYSSPEFEYDHQPSTMNIDNSTPWTNVYERNYTNIPFQSGIINEQNMMNMNNNNVQKYNELYSISPEPKTLPQDYFMSNTNPMDNNYQNVNTAPNWGVSTPIPKITHQMNPSVNAMSSPFTNNLNNGQYYNPPQSPISPNNNQLGINQSNQLPNFGYSPIIEKMFDFFLQEQKKIISDYKTTIEQLKQERDQVLYANKANEKRIQAWDRIKTDQEIIAHNLGYSPFDQKYQNNLEKTLNTIMDKDDNINNNNNKNNYNKGYNFKSKYETSQSNFDNISSISEEKENNFIVADTKLVKQTGNPKLLETWIKEEEELIESKEDLVHSREIMMNNPDGTPMMNSMLLTNKNNVIVIPNNARKKEENIEQNESFPIYCNENEEELGEGREANISEDMLQNKEMDNEANYNLNNELEFRIEHNTEAQCENNFDADINEMFKNSNLSKLRNRDPNVEYENEENWIMSKSVSDIDDLPHKEVQGNGNDISNNSNINNIGQDKDQNVNDKNIKDQSVDCKTSIVKGNINDKINVWMSNDFENREEEQKQEGENTENNNVATKEKVEEHSRISSTHSWDKLKEEDIKEEIEIDPSNDYEDINNNVNIGNISNINRDPTSNHLITSPQETQGNRNSNLLNYDNQEKNSPKNPFTLVKYEEEVLDYNENIDRNNECNYNTNTELKHSQLHPSDTSAEILNQKMTFFDEDINQLTKSPLIMQSRQMMAMYPTNRLPRGVTTKNIENLNNIYEKFKKKKEKKSECNSWSNTLNNNNNNNNNNSNINSNKDGSILNESWNAFNTKLNFKNDSNLEYSNDKKDDDDEFLSKVDKFKKLAWNEIGESQWSVFDKGNLVSKRNVKKYD